MSPSPGETAGPRGPEREPLLSVGRVLAGRFRVLAFLGHGATGEVYEAEDAELGERVAVKVLRPEIAADAVSLERFRREVQLARRISSPHVCRLFDLFEDRRGDRRLLFLTMERLSGTTLAERLGSHGRLTPEQALPLVRAMAAALDAAHAAGVVHRDLKSSNVFLHQEAEGAPRVVLTDFGLARALSAGTTLTGSGSLVGSPAYMAPEQVRGEPIGAAADLFSLGVVIYEMVTGRLPFEAETAFGTALKRLHESPPPPRRWVPDLDPVWESVLLRCLETEPEARFDTAAEVVAALEGGELPARRERSGARSGSRASRSPVLRAGLVVALLAALALAGVWGFQRDGRAAESPRPLALADRADGLYQEHDLEAAAAVYRELLARLSESASTGVTGGTAEELESAARAHVGLSRIASLHKDLATAREEARLALAFERRRGPAADLPLALHRLGILDFRLGDSAAARHSFEEMMVLARIRGDDAQVAQAWDLLALIAQQHGSLPTAARAYAAAREVYQKLGRAASVASASQSLGSVRMHQGRLGEAGELLGEALEAYRALGSTPGEAAVRMSLAELLRAQGRDGEALAQTEQAVALLGEGGGAALARAQAVLGELTALEANTSERAAEGRRTVEAAVATLEELGGNQGLDLALAALGRVLGAQGDLQGAQRAHRRALEIRRGVDDRLGSGEDLMALAEVALAQGVDVEAEALAGRAVEALRACGAEDLEARARLVLARAMAARGDRDAAEEELSRVRARAEVTESPRLRRELARTEHEIGR